MKFRAAISLLAVLLTTITAGVVAHPAAALAPAGGSGWFWQAPQLVGSGMNAVAFAGQDDAWAAGDNGDLLHSADAGATWAVQASGTLAQFTAVAFADSGHGWVAGTDASAGTLRTVLLSTGDGGATWAPAPARPLTGMPLAMSFPDARHGWLACLTSISFDFGPGGIVFKGKLLTTADGGATWAPVSLGLGTVPTKVRFLDTAHGWVGDDRGYVWRTSDGGAHWRCTTLPGAGEHHAVSALDFSDALHGWAVVTDWETGHGIRLSATSDGGRSWHRAGGPGGVLYDLVAAPDGRVLILGGATDQGPALVATSADGGAHWSRHIIGSPGLYAGALAVAGDACVAAGDQVATSADGGQTWRSGTSGTRFALTDAAMVSAGEGWAVGRGVIVHTGDGARWRAQWAGSGALYGVSFANAQDGWAAGAHGLILHTADGGTSWSRQDAGTAADFIGVDFPTPLDGWVVADSPDDWATGKFTVARHTTDGGLTWAAVTVPYGFSAEAVAFVDAQHGWVGGTLTSTCGVLRTTDGGLTWTRHRLPTMEAVTDVFFLDRQEGWVSGTTMDNDGYDSSYVAHTTDGGATWQRSAGVYDTYFRSIYFADASHGWAAGDGGLYCTVDGGATWQELAAHGTWSLVDVCGVDAARVWAFGEPAILSNFDVAGDTAAPATLDDSDAAWHGGAVTVHLTPNDIGGSDVLRTEYRLPDDPVWREGTAIAVAAPADHSGDGLHVLHYRSLDTAGNAEMTETCAVYIDTRRPTPATRQEAHVFRGRRVSLRYVVRDACPDEPRASVVVEVKDGRGHIVKRFTPAGVAANAQCLVRFRCTLPRGTYRFTVRATDAAGNPGTTVAHNRLVVK